jgi:hypothetical protein
MLVPLPRSARKDAANVRVYSCDAALFWLCRGMVPMVPMMSEREARYLLYQELTAHRILTGNIVGDGERRIEDGIAVLLLTAVSLLPAVICGFFRILEFSCMTSFT